MNRRNINRCNRMRGANRGAPQHCHQIMDPRYSKSNIVGLKNYYNDPSQNFRQVNSNNNVPSQNFRQVNSNNNVPGQNFRQVNSNNNVPSGQGHFSNGNSYVFTHRMEEQYSVEVKNSAEQNRQNVSNVISIAPVPKITHSRAPVQVGPLVEQTSASAPDSLAVAGYAGVAKNANADSEFSVHLPSHPLLAEGDDDDGIDDSDSTKEVAHHYQLLGEKIAETFTKNVQLSKNIQVVKKYNQNLLAQKQALESQLLLVQQENEESTKNYYKNITEKQAELSQELRDLSSWRDKAMKTCEELESVKAELQQLKIRSQEHIENLKEEQKKKMMEYDSKLEQNEKRFKSHIATINQTVEQQKREITKKCEEVEKAEAKYREKAKTMQRLDDENVGLKKDFNLKIINEQKKIRELEAAKCKSDAKVQELEDTVEKYKGENMELECIKKQLELTIQGLNENIKVKEKEIGSINDERDSLKLETEAQGKMLKEQNNQITNLKSSVDSLTAKNNELVIALEKETELKSKILTDYMEQYTRPSILNGLVREKILNAPPLLQRTQLALTQSSDSISPCPAPAAAEEIPHEVTSQVPEHDQLRLHLTRKRKNTSNSTSIIHDEGHQGTRRSRWRSKDKSDVNDEDKTRIIINMGKDLMQQGTHGRISLSADPKQPSSNLSDDSNNSKESDQHKRTRQTGYKPRFTGKLFLKLPSINLRKLDLN